MSTITTPPKPQLTPHDTSILQKIADPESSPSATLLISDSLPKDPHYPSPPTYQEITASEKAIIYKIQTIELRLFTPDPPSKDEVLTVYKSAITQLTSLISQYPNYASLRNNRAQALRRIYGDSILTTSTQPAQNEGPPPLVTSPSEEELLSAGSTILNDLSTAIHLLAPQTPSSPLSPAAAKTLANAYTQRGALYHITSKALSQPKINTSLRIDETRREKNWTVIDFEEAASRDFTMGGRLGNEVARQMAVMANPTAKLCGDIVREAMSREFGVKS